MLYNPDSHEVILRPSQPDGVMASVVNLPYHTFTGQASSSKRLTSIVRILLPETDNCPYWISGRERMTVENISRSISAKECCWPWRGSNPQPPGLQLDAHPTEPRRPAKFMLMFLIKVYRGKHYWGELCCPATALIFVEAEHNSQQYFSHGETLPQNLWNFLKTYDEWQIQVLPIKSYWQRHQAANLFLKSWQAGPRIYMVNM